MNKRLVSCMWPGLPERGWTEKESEHSSRALQILKCRELYSELFTQTVLAFYQFRQDLCKWERERERWSRRFIMQLSENAFLLLHILVALIKVPAAHIYTTVTLRFPPSPASCTYILSQDPTSLPAVDTGHSGRTREQTHKNMQKETEFPTSRQCPSTRVHNVL